MEFTIPGPDAAATQHARKRRGVSDGARPDFSDSAAAAAEWQLCAAAIAGRPAMRLLVRRGGRPVYPPSTQRPLTDTPPATPAAVMLFDATGRLQCLALDLDAGKAGADQVAADAVAAVQLLSEAGLRPFTDTSPSGGRHVYAALPQPAPAHEVAQVATALARLLPSLDPSPLLNPAHGCLRPPGAVHKAGGHQRLVPPLHAVQEALTAEQSPQAWQTLRTLLRADRVDVEPSAADVDAAPPVGVCKRPLAGGYDALARTGRHPDRAYPSPSEARMAVIGATVRAGWALADVDHAITSTWTWLRNSYTSKYGQRWRTRVAREFTKAKSSRSEHLCRRSLRRSDTSQRIHSTGGALAARTLPLTGATGDPYLLLRKFFSFTTDYARHRGFTPTQRSVLRSAIWVAQVQGGLTISSGCRSLAEQAGCHFDTVAVTLHQLAAHKLVIRLREGTGLEPDLWLLNVELGHDSRPVRGRIQGLHPVFRVIGGHDTAELYEELRRSPTPLAAEGLATRLGYSSTRIYEQLRLLAGWDLAARTVHGWGVGSGDLDALSRRLGGHDHWQAQHDRHVSQRERWREALLSKGHLPRLAGQLAWDTEFALVADDADAWVQDFAGGSPPNRSVDEAVTLVRRALGGEVIA